MARSKDSQSNIDKSDLVKYPNGRLQNNSGAGDGTPVNEFIYGDIHEFFAKTMRLYGITHNGLSDNESNGYQLVDSVIALASKNDYVLNLSRSGLTLSIPIKIGSLQDNESLVCKALIDKGSETSIKSTLDNSTKTVSYVGEFKIGEYIRLINTSTGIILVRLVDEVNLESANLEKGFLQPATAPETIAATLSNKGVTPESFLAAFAEYVLGNESANFLASKSRNGIYPKEHYSIVENLTASQNLYGTITPFDVSSRPSVGSSAVTTGDIKSALVRERIGQGESYTVTLNSSMNNLDYSLSFSVESLSSDLDDDNDVQEIIWKRISTSSFIFFIEENSGNIQNIKLHIDIIQR